MHRKIDRVVLNLNFYGLCSSSTMAEEVPLELEMDSGEKRLNELGYKQELRRQMVLYIYISILLLSLSLRLRNSFLLISDKTGSCFSFIFQLKRVEFGYDEWFYLLLRPCSRASQYRSQRWRFSLGWLLSMAPAYFMQGQLPLCGVGL